MMQLCDKCQNILSLQAFTTTKCEQCGAEIVTGHIPGYKICIKCSTSLNLCQQCGKPIEGEE